MSVKKFIFNKYDESILKRIEEFLKYLDLMPEIIYNNYDIFKQDSFIFKDKNELLKKLNEDIIYQVNIAKNIIYNSKKENIKTKLTSYYWICEIEEVENYKYLNVEILIEPEDKNLGEIGFPIVIVATKVNEFRYWEILDIDSAMQSIRDIYGQLGDYM